jgi:agmatinase
VKPVANNEHIYADANAGFNDADLVLLGIPFDGTSSHRCGSAKAPNAIRHESDNFETYLPRYDYKIDSSRIHDMGDVKGITNVQELMDKVPGIVREVISSNKFLMALGGEHTITIPIIKTHKEFLNASGFGIIYFDAHLDFRDSYLNEKLSHACVSRRLTELVGVDKVVGIGIRSYSKQEASELGDMNLRFYSVDTVNELGMAKIIRETLAYLDVTKIYVSIDMDVFDPSFAPGVGNPEYFGLSPEQVRSGLEELAPYMISADIVEVSPPYDNGNTAALAAQLIQVIIGNVQSRK